ncbi:MAG: bifunctional folylpolyglutamate synthase/dihydrofolate synthase [Acidobacteriota bacterium]|nr:bifunctional folylpolyglutamate synthase/dihydrofolate synthase [Acidobacteriota bacterium]
MSFKETLQYLYGLGNEVSTMKLGLENIGKLLAALENPEKIYPKIQIAGTNGKGSTCAFLEAICLSARIKTGLTTSPHLISITERIKIGGREISEKDFARHATKIREISEKLISEKKLETFPTFFEQITAIALSAFAEAKIELAILETGLGGRFDAMTAAQAEVVAITPIDFDHQQILGDTIRLIAVEKAAIIRENTKVVVARQKPEALSVILERCAKLGITPNLTNVEAEVIGTEDKKFIVGFQTEKAKYENVKLNLSGRHQIENAKTAILLAETLQENFNITTKNIIDGLQTAIHKGRLEFRENILFDGAHNISGAKALKKFLDEFAEQPVTFVFGAMKDKDLQEITKILFTANSKIILTKPNNSRAASTAELINFLSAEINLKNVFQTEAVAEALKLAQEMASENDLICVTGSLYLIGEAQKYLESSRNTTAC